MFLIFETCWFIKHLPKSIITQNISNLLSGSRTQRFKTIPCHCTWAWASSIHLLSWQPISISSHHLLDLPSTYFSTGFPEKVCMHILSPISALNFISLKVVWELNSPLHPSYVHICFWAFCSWTLLCVLPCNKPYLTSTYNTHINLFMFWKLYRMIIVSELNNDSKNFQNVFFSLYHEFYLYLLLLFPDT
jgi:hypothetical protein